MKYECNGCGLDNKCVIDVGAGDLTPAECPYGYIADVCWKQEPAESKQVVPVYLTTIEAMEWCWKRSDYCIVIRHKTAPDKRLFRSSSISSVDNITNWEWNYIRGGEVGGEWKPFTKRYCK